MAEEATQQTGEATAQGDAESTTKPSGQPVGDKGFPENTPLEQMSVEQQLAYYKHHSRKWEGRAKQFEGINPDELPEVLDKASKYDALEYELKSEQDKALDAARQEAAEQARAELLPRLVEASFDAEAARLGVDADKLAAQLKYTDMNKFVVDGKVDADAVREYVEQLKPAEPQRQKFPSGIGLGNRGGGGYAPGERGKAEAQRRFGVN